MEIVAHRVRGCEIKQIAGHLGISIPTVKTHLARIFKKWKICCSLELAQYVMVHNCRNCPHRLRDAPTLPAARRNRLTTLQASAGH
jgi:hypothetical protein